MQSSDVHIQADPTPDENDAGIGLIMEGRARRDILRSRGTTRFEIWLLALIAVALLLPGIWRYSLIDPWESHYAEVARRMLQDDDLVRTQWQNEGFRSKPVLTFWMMAASMRAMGVAEDGGYSGEMTSSETVMFAVRLPSVIAGIIGLLFLWWMLARLVNRRVAWLAFLIVATTPFYFMVARHAITDMPTLACIMGAIACLLMAENAGDAPLRPVIGRLNGLHLYLAVVTAFVGWQAFYYGYHFAVSGHRAVAVFAPHVLLPLCIILSLGLFVAWAVFLQPTRYARQVYMYWFYTLVFVGVLTKGLLPIALTGMIALFYLVLTAQWARVLAIPMAPAWLLVGRMAKARAAWAHIERLELPRAVLLFVLIVLPWHLGMWIEEGPVFIREWVMGHNWNRFFTDKMHGDHGTFAYFMSQIGIGMWPWIAFLPAAAASVFTKVTGMTREGRVRLVMGIWAIGSVAFFAVGRTKFHHYILPAIPAMGVLVAFFLDDLIVGRVRRVGLLMLFGTVITLLIMRDMMFEQKQLIELAIYRYDRPWPGDPPWNIDLSDAFLAFGLVFAGLVFLFAARSLRKLALTGLIVASLAFAYWTMNVYMSYAGMHWGQRIAVKTYYQKRQIHGLDIWYYGARQVTDEWDGFKGLYPIDTVIPEHLSPGQPMKITIQLKNRGNQTEREVVMNGSVARIDEHRIWVELPEEELMRVQPLVELGRKRPRPRTKPWRMVNADRLIAWQLYWRGENFWSGDEIWGRDPDTRTAFKNTDNAAFLEYLNGEGRKGRRYFVVTEAGRAKGLVNILPTTRAKSTYEIIDRSSNKFTLATFVL